MKRGAPPVHFSRERYVSEALRVWTPLRLMRAMEQLADASLEMRRNASLAETIAQRTLLSLATNARKTVSKFCPSLPNGTNPNKTFRTDQSIFVKHFEMATITRQLCRPSKPARSLESRAKFWHVAIVSLFFVAVVGSGLFLGTVMVIGTLQVTVQTR